MSDFLDRMCDAYWESIRPVGDTSRKKFADLNDWVRVPMRESMRWVLHAMKTPTPAMCEAAKADGHAPLECARAWEAMIDAALKEYA